MIGPFSLMSEITVIARSSDVKAISAVLETLQSPIAEDTAGGGGMKFAVREVADGEDVGSADALLTLRGRVKVGVVCVFANCVLPFSQITCFP